MRKILAITGIVIGFMAMGLSFSMINANLETLQNTLGASLVQLQWIINIYGIFIASTLVAMGRLGDIFGRKRVYLVGKAFFALAMLGGGFASSASVIIAFMPFWGLAGAIMLPLSQTLLIHMYPEEKKGIAMGIWNSSGGISLALGPLFGGFLLKFFDWRWIFLSSIPLIIIGCFLTAYFVKESKTEGESTKIDWAGVFALMAAIASFVLATVQSNIWPAHITTILYLFCACSILSLIFIEGKVKMPIIREDLLKNRSFLLCCMCGFAMIGIFWSEIFLLPFYIQKQLQFTPLQTGIIMLGFAVPIAIFSPLAGHLYHKMPPRILIFIGFLFLAISCLLQLGFATAPSTYFVTIAIAFIGLGLSLVMTPTLAKALSAISRNFGGVASGTYVTLQEIGGSVGLAISVTVARKAANFSLGFHNAIWVVLALTLLGAIAALVMPKASRSFPQV